jgi:PTS system nitrogen regulatory IIA component
VNRIAALLEPAAIILDHEAADREAVLDLLAARFAAPAGLAAATVRRSLAEREALGSTGLGQGVAIPHGRVRGLARAQAVLLRLARPVDFDAPDGRPVGVFLALLVPEKATQEHLELLSDIAQLLSDRQLREALAGAGSPAELSARLAAWSPEQPTA